jgi:acetyl esterase
MMTQTPSVTRDPALDPQLAELLSFMDAASTKAMWEGTATEARAAFRALTVDMRDPASVPEVASVEEIRVPGGAGDLPARVYRPVAAGARPTIAFFHGGGWVIGDLDTHDLTCRTLAVLCDAVVVSVDYRLAPEHPAPASGADALASARWVSDHLSELGGTDVMGVAGDSAGGNLSAVVAQTFRDEGRALAGQLLIYPATDFSGDYPSLTDNAEGYFLDMATMSWFLEQYVGQLGGEGLDAPALSPIHGDLTGLAPAVVVVAQFDPLRDQGLAYAEKLSAAGVPTQSQTYAGLIHGFVDMGRYSPAAQAAIEETFAMFRTVLHP